MGDSDPNIVTGRNVLFVGGPEAGNVRVVPESFGDVLQGEADFMYKVWPFNMTGHKATMYLACSADQHPMEMLLELWREYSPAAQIKTKTGIETYQRVKPA